ncbi:hypothetical protein KFK09_016901 [Dendrobium nobile]|uniref:Uncharacterized protein n=1 Tax=Dendrobium nobile TaxID=94219 RepID=A0A8T3AZG2_DENNO|nr:hypothetical protein KFK09_016901 [Dendrobium nobile]
MPNEQCTLVGFNIGRPFNHSLFAPDLAPIYGPCHSRKSINRALILHKGGSKQEARGEGAKEEAPPQPPPEPRRTTAGASPDHHRNLAGPPPGLAGPPLEPRRTTTSRPDVQVRSSGPTFRPDIQARHSAQVPTFC